jgi:hypothetical protein
MRGCGGAGHDRLFREQLRTAFISQGMQYYVRMISCISEGSVFHVAIMPDSD